MSGLDAAEVRRLLEIARTADTDDARGKAYEFLAEYLFTSVDGCFVECNIISPLQAEQIDLAVAHVGALLPLPTFFFVECKFWNSPVDSAAVGYFINVCSNRRVPLGIIISDHGITGVREHATAAHSIAFAASGRGQHLIVVTTADLLALTSSDDFVRLLRQAYMMALATGGVGFIR